MCLTLMYLYVKLTRSDMVWLATDVILTQPWIIWGSLNRSIAQITRGHVYEESPNGLHGRAQTTVGAATPGQVVLVCIK